MTNIAIVMFMLAFPLLGMILGYFFRWKLLILLTVGLSFGFAAYMLNYVEPGSHEGGYAIFGGTFLLVLLFLFGAWTTRLVCFLVQRYRSHT